MRASKIQDSIWNFDTAEIEVKSQKHFVPNCGKNTGSNFSSRSVSPQGKSCIVCFLSGEHRYSVKIQATERALYLKRDFLFRLFVCLSRFKILIDFRVYAVVRTLRQLLEDANFRRSLFGSLLYLYGIWMPLGCEKKTNSRILWSRREL